MIVGILDTAGLASVVTLVDVPLIPVSFVPVQRTPLHSVGVTCWAGVVEVPVPDNA